MTRLLRRRWRLLVTWLRELRHLRWLEHGRAWGSDGEVPVSLWPSVPEDVLREARRDAIRDATPSWIDDATDRLEAAYLLPSPRSGEER